MIVFFCARPIYLSTTIAIVVVGKLVEYFRFFCFVLFVGPWVHKESGGQEDGQQIGAYCDPRPVLTTISYNSEWEMSNKIIIWSEKVFRSPLLCLPVKLT